MKKIALPISFGKTTFQINKAYVEYLHEAGYEPILITPRSSIAGLAKFCDGLLLPGGIDIDPIFYNEDNVASNGVDPVKDDFERNCFYAFIKEAKPIFGICRGFQLIAREFMRHGLPGSEHLKFWQHINHHRNTSELNVERHLPTHSVDADIEMMYGNDEDLFGRIYVNSIHHQALVMKKPMENEYNYHGSFKALALTNKGLPKKGSGPIIEAFDVRDWNEAPIRAVQWHPEELRDVHLLNYFFDTVAVNKKQNNVKGKGPVQVSVDVKERKVDGKSKKG